MTLVFSAGQGLLAARAGASYISPFVGRLDDIGFNGINLVSDLKEIFKINNVKTEIIVASVRNSEHVIKAAKIGADIVTVPYKIIMQMIEHPLTKAGIEKFLIDWEGFNKKAEI